MSLDKTLLTSTALRDGLKILWRPGAFWIAKDRVGQALIKRFADAVRVAFHCSPRKSIRGASNKLAIPRSIVHKVLHKQLPLYAYKLQIVQALKPDDRPRPAAFAEEIFQRIDDDSDYQCDLYDGYAIFCNNLICGFLRRSIFSCIWDNQLA